jgi:drug/metabolite transporter (DMT)-like permease
VRDSRDVLSYSPSPREAGRGATPDTARPARRTASGIAFIAASALCFGSLPIFARAAYAAGADVPSVLLMRFTCAGAVLWAVVAARRKPVPRGRALATLAAMGAIGYAGQAFAYFTALTLASAGLVALLLYLYPALVAILSRVAFAHALSRLQLAAIGLALAGSALTIGRAGDGKPLGIALGLAAAAIYACYIVAGSRLPRAIGSAASSAVITSSAAAVYAVAALVRGVRLPATPAGWGAVLAVAVVCTVLAIAFFMAGLERLGPVRASIYSTLEPVFTVALAAVALGERVTPLRAAGGALILVAVVLLARGEEEPRGV